MAASNDQFYSRLPVNRITLRDLLEEEHLFYKIPDDWHVIITDIKGSTSAVQNGQHETVNYIATGSIVAVLNITFKTNTTIPFFFGGDGATFLIPASVKEVALSALQIHSQQTQAQFGLTLRVGSVAIKDIYAAGHTLTVSKFCSAGNFTIPIVLGDGLYYAEQLIKGPDYLLTAPPAEGEELDLSGMQCRWDQVPPPLLHYEVVTLIAVATAGAQQAAAYGKVIAYIDDIYGAPEQRQPISVSKLKLTSSFQQLGMEMRTRFGSMKLLQLLYAWCKNRLGYFYFKTKTGKTYLSRLVEMSDTLVIDGKINTVITGTAEQRLQLQHALSAMEDAGEIVYGYCVSKASVMSCYVRDLKDDHIHFVDGAEGGYTKAAGVLKLKAIENKQH
ncbi:DUF3095 domain-containing protein [Chitinophaga agrisoli]|uniref:DUF3095 domain-containing protein n=1 Tax=Chitinophaga agrisoli TaxID=2607653 RepID=A0A5B2VW47_9BACT|nr:DUF3095 domain-containing protein [Chitinophaga agrisoli]KAA2243531.1 DUF3095 domain-containing protein [Chitinophaga agrisoli]